MYLLDSDTLSLLFDGHAKVAQQLAAATDDVGTTIVNQIELLQVRYRHLLTAESGERLRVAQEWLNRTIELLSQFAALPIDDASAAEFDRLRTNRKLRKIGRADLLIASIALANDAVLVTRNVRDFAPVPDLEVENWSE
jgi:tRNA(fMet)-specific endonuclease VapC